MMSHGVPLELMAAAMGAEQHLHDSKGGECTNAALLARAMAKVCGILVQTFDGGEVPLQF